MSNWYDNVPTYTELTATIVVGRPAFVASFYADSGFMPHAQATFDAWLELLPPKSTAYCSHQNTKRYAKLTPKAIAKVRDALSVRSIRKEFQWYHAKTAAPTGAADECHAFSFETFVSEEGNSYVYVTFPRDHVATQGADSVVQWFSDWCARLGFTHAGAGFGYEVAWFPDQAQHAYKTMLTTGLRFHGVRVWNRDNARFREQGPETLDTAAWLTFLDRSSIQRLGPAAIERIDPGVVRHRCGTGVVLQAGPEPDPADTNRRGPAYALLKSVNDAIEPIRTRKWWINRFAGPADKENDWFERMDG